MEDASIASEAENLLTSAASTLARNGSDDSQDITQRGKKLSEAKTKTKESGKGSCNLLVSLLAYFLYCELTLTHYVIKEGALF